MHQGTSLLLSLLLCLLMVAILPTDAKATPYRVLVVMSYHETQPTELATRQGIEQALGGKAEIRYAYLDTRHNAPQGEERAREAFALYREFAPDGVIAADDEAQFLFVLPYLKERVRTPVIFCGVNADPARYGYPARNVSGVVERSHIGASIALLQQLVPTVKRLAIMAPDDTMGRIYREQVEREAHSSSAEALPIRLVKNLDEALEVASEQSRRSEALLLLAMSSIEDAAGNRLTDSQIFRAISQRYGKPVIGVNDYEIRHGLLCAVAKSGTEQGTTAARMLLRAMGGTPVSRIPVITSNDGKRMINVTVMKALGITPRPIVLRGVELVTTTE